MTKNCAVCGNELDDEIKFCPDCGEKAPQENETEKNVEETKTEDEKQKSKIKLPKISLKNTPKPVITGIILLCVAIVVIASVVIISPFDLSGSVTNSGDNGIDNGVLTINIANTCDESAKCYLTVSGLKYTHFGNGGDFTVKSGDTMDINIVKEVLFNKNCDNYEISLYVEFDHLEKATVFDVSESADFSILPLEQEGEFSIETVSVR